MRVRTTGTKAAVGVVITITLFVVTATVGLRTIARLEKDAALQSRAAEVATRLERLLSLVKDAETGARGYIITGDERYLEPFISARRNTPGDIVELRRLVLDPDQRRRLDSLAMLVERDFVLLEERIEARDRGGFAAAQRLVARGTVKATTDSIRTAMSVMESAEAATLAERRSRTEGAIAAARRTIIAVIALAVIAGIAAIFMLIAAVRAKEEVIRLSRMLPICAWCKNVRDDEGYWRQIEAYMSEHSGAEFTHGICPSCAARLTPQSA